MKMLTKIWSFSRQFLHLISEYSLKLGRLLWWPFGKLSGLVGLLARKVASWLPEPIKRPLRQVQEQISGWWKNDSIWAKLFPVVVVLGALTFFAVNVLSPSLHARRLAGARVQLQEVLDDINGLQEPRLIELGQKDTTLKFQIEELTLLYADSLQPAPLPPGWALSANVARSPIKAEEPINLNEVTSLQRQYMTDINNLYAHQLQVLTLLKPVFEINAVAEFAVLDPKSDQVAAKADSIGEVASTARESLAATKTNSPFQDDQQIDGLTQTLDQFDEAIESFKESRNLEGLSNALRDLQQSLVDNRQDFWSTQKEQWNEKLIGLNAQLGQLEAIVNGLE